MSILRFAVVFAALGLAAGAQGKGGALSGKYRNSELGLTFAGVYGWESEFAQGSGAWSDLATYRDRAFDAIVRLQVRNNIYATMADLRKALEKEFAGSGAPAAGKSAYKEVVFKQVEMKRGVQLKGIEVDAYVTRVTDEGKKRERFVMVRTYLAKNRLFRVDCSVRRSRAKRVKDLFGTAMASLSVTGAAEQVATGTRFQSQRGKYSCLVPSGFSVVLPSSRSKSDMRFGAGQRGLLVTVYSYGYDGELIDHRELLSDYYQDDLKLEEDDVKLMGGMGFRGILTRGDKITLIAGTVRNSRAYRVHTSASKSRIEDARRVQAAFLKGFRITR